MRKVAIITDSNSGITQEMGKELGIYVLPMPFTIDGKEFTNQNNSLHPTLQDYQNVLEVNKNDTIYVDHPIENVKVYKQDSLIPINTNVQYADSNVGIILKGLEPNQYVISFHHKPFTDSFTTYSLKINVTE